MNADDERMNSLLIIVMINSPRYAGTCWMFGYTVNDFGDGIAIAYVPTELQIQSGVRLCCTSVVMGLRSWQMNTGLPLIMW